MRPTTQVTGKENDMIKARIDGVELKISEREPLLAGTVGLNKISLSFSDEWAIFTKQIDFTNEQSGETRRISAEVGVCTVPWELLKAEGDITCYVRGIGSDGRLVLRTNEANLGTVLGGDDGDVPGTGTPTPDVCDETAAKIGDLSKLETNDKSQLVAAINELKRADGLGVFEVTLTSADGVLTADKTFEQVKAAVADGKPVLKVHSDGDVLWFFLLDKSPAEIDFVGFVDEQILAYLTAKQDGSWETTVTARVTAEMFSALSEKLGNLNNLTTTEKTSLVAAINELKSGAAVTEATVSGWGFTKNTGTYSKPAGGIPKTDLAPAVQTSLGKVEKLAAVATSGSYNDLTDKPTESQTITSPAYTNQIPLSVDASGAVYNGVGYKSGYYLDSAGSEVSGSGVVVSGYIPVKKGDIIRIKDTSQASIDTTLALTLTAAKAGTASCGKTIAAIQSNTLYGTMTVNGNVATWDTSGIGYYFWNDFAWLRVTTHSADAIVTVNEEITDTVTTQNVLKPSVKVKKANVDFDIASPLLSGKTVVCFGDSIFGMTRDTTSVPAWAAAFTGAKVYNVGFGGCRMAVHPTSGYAAFSMWALADAVATGTYTTQDAQAASGADYFAQQLAVLKGIDFANVDMAVIHYGTNDFTGNVAIDNAADDDDTATLCGALRYAIRKLQAAYPKLRIFVSLPIYRKWDSVGAESYTNSGGKTLREFGTALAGVADEFNCPCIDGYKALGINAANAAAFLADGTHLNDYGRQAFGEYIGGCLISPEACAKLTSGASATAAVMALRSVSTGEQDTVEGMENVALTVASGRLTNVSYTARYSSLLGMVFVRICGTVNADMNTGYDYDIMNIGARLPNSHAALAVKSSKAAQAFAKSSGVISLRPLESGIKNYDIYITGFWFA